MSDENLLWLINWYDSHCDGDWERLFGIEINSIDNPGWAVTISIQETDLKEKKFQKVFINRSKKDWFVCKIENGFFNGYCGTFNFFEVLQSFRKWATDKNNLIIQNNDNFHYPLDDYWLWLINWYDSQCNEDWEHSYGIVIKSLDNPGWSISIDVSDTDLEDKIFEKVCIERSEKNWLLCKVENGSFQAHCGTFNLMDVFETFKNWAES